jgi:hypothetical protein
MKFLKIVIAIIISLSGLVPISAALDPQWHISTVDSAGAVGEYVSMAMDNSGNPHISYYDYYNRTVKYAKRIGSAWQISTVGSAGDEGGYTSIALDDAGNPHISFCSATFSEGDLKYAERSMIMKWNISILDSKGNVGRYNSIALDDAGNPHISYYNATSYDGNLKYAEWNGFGGWLISTVDSAGWAGEYTSLALDDAGNPHISYYAWGEGLKYAKRNGSVWNITIVDSAGDVGRDTSLKLDRSGRPHISYYDYFNDTVKYARWTGSAWEISIVDTAGDVGGDTSIALDSSDNPHISYCNATPSDGDLKYAKWTGSAWDIDTVDPVGNVGYFTSIALDSSGNPRISYYDLTNTDLKYAEFIPIQTQIGVFRNSTHLFYIDYNGNGVWNGASVDRQYNFGIIGDIPISGDWDYNRKSEIGVFRPSTHLFYLDYNGNGVWNGAVTDRQYNFGLSGDTPVSGDWNSDGKTEIGVFRNSTHLFYLDYNGNGVWNGASVDRQYNFGLSGDIPVFGDWNLDGRTEIGVFRPSTHLFYLDYNGNGMWNGASLDRQYNFGLTGDIPVTGDWNTDGKYEIGVFRPSTHLFYLDYNGNGFWNGAVTDRQYNYGLTGDKPVSGKW